MVVVPPDEDESFRPPSCIDSPFVWQFSHFLTMQRTVALCSSSLSVTHDDEDESGSGHLKKEF